MLKPIAILALFMLSITATLAHQAMPIVYPAGIDPTQYDWSLESSTNMVNWSPEPSWRDGSAIVYQQSKLSPFFIRLKGTPIQ